MKSRSILALLAFVVSTALVAAVVDAQKSPADRRAAAAKAFKQGNFKDAYQGYRRLVLDKNVEARLVGADLNRAAGCLTRLNRPAEIDSLREQAVKIHAKNWRLLKAAAQSYLSGVHYGYMIAGKFERGQHRGGGEIVNAVQRDRVRALQLMVQATALAQQDDKKADVSEFFMSFSRMLLNNRGANEAWRLQTLSDLSKLPDYEPGWGYGRNSSGAPVDAKGNPVFHHIPKTFAAAKTDGQRWRWTLVQAVENNPRRNNEVRTHFAQFLQQQFGVQTMAYYGRRFFRQDFSNGADNDSKQNESGVYALHTLGENETIARLATGIKRFDLPDEFNFIKIFRQIADGGKSTYGQTALSSLATTFENRRQYPKAADLWRRSIKQYGDPHRNKKSRLDQIVGNWGRFDPVMTQPSDKGATVDFRYRNAATVEFVAHQIKIDKLLNDVKAYIKTKPARLDWNALNIQDIGHRLVTRNQSQYIGSQVAKWKLPLKPRKHHFDRRTTVTTPLQKAGAYLLTSRVGGGNVNKIVVWISDTAIAKKPLAGKTMYYVADANDGTPIKKANVELFGYRQVFVGKGKFRIDTLNFAEFTGANGQVLLGPKRLPDGYQWIVTARTDSGRYAFLGYDRVWHGSYRQNLYNQLKIFTITDRPVYRPKNDVQFKAWVHRARYDQDSKSEFAHHKVTVEIYNPKGEKIDTKNLTTDEYGGLSGKITLPADATLGVYRINTKVFQKGKHIVSGGLSFRVEEYKKPEFEVAIDAPDEPVKLGEKISAKIRANYFFGAPVTEATVKYKVIRTSHASRWYPRGEWDWFYGSGYWWYASDYSWYPGWHRWGCKGPVPFWWRGRNYERPEIVAEREVKIGRDGTVRVEIDTAAAKAVHPDQDHQYQIIAEVVDRSRRTIVGIGTVLVARRPFKVFTWVDRGYYRTGDPITASFSAHTLDQKPVQGKGKLRLLRITYDTHQKPIETEVGSWAVNTNAQGHASHKMTAATAGQYRLSYKLTDAKEQTIEGGYLFTVTGQGFDGGDFRFSHLELVPEKREYRPGETLKLMVNTNRTGSTVLLFIRPVGGIYFPPRILHIKGKSTVVDIKIELKDMPNFFVEAITISGGKLHSQTREILVPPEKRVLDVAVTPSSKSYLPGQQATVEVKLTDASGEPFVGSTVVSIYDKAVEYISGGSNVPEIKSFFWKWRRHHYPWTVSSLGRYSRAYDLPKKPRMNDLGAFGATVADQEEKLGADPSDAADGAKTEAAPEAAVLSTGKGRDRNMVARRPNADFGLRKASNKYKADAGGLGGAAGPLLIGPTVRSKFADTAFWAASITTNKLGIAQIALKMPENLTTWKIKAWAMGHGTKVGQGEAEVITKKNLIVRMQTPRFFVEKDEVVLSANVHNYLKTAKQVRVQLALDDAQLLPITDLIQTIKIDAGGEARVDWRVQVAREGVATVRMSALSDEESDAVEMKLPVYVHGMLKTESWTGSIRPEDSTAGFTLSVPQQRRIGQSWLEVRYSPTLAGAMVDALPYLADYPYGCTEQTLNRFVPTVITQKILLEMNIDLAAVQKKRTNLNAQEIGDDVERAKGWKRFERNPVFDKREVDRMVKAGVQRLTEMQISDGGWGWFSGWGEQSTPHTTAVVVHGLQRAQANDVALVPGILKRGVGWLQNYQNTQVTRLKNAATKTKPYKISADNLDALVYMVLVDAKVKNNEMRDFLYRDRTRLAVYSMAMIGIAYEKQGENQKLEMIMKNISQYVVQDNENETAYLNLPEGNYWWHWYGSENEAHAYYLKLLAKTDPQGKTAPRLVKYLLNNRKHATYWNSTRDTALCIEALADYLRASGEQEPDLTVEVWVGGKRVKTERITAENLFTFDNRLVLSGEAIRSGKTQIEIKKTGTGPLYFNAYLTNFTLEDHITHAGLEVKVRRKYYKLKRVDAREKVAGSRGQAVDQKIEKYQRTLLENLATLKSGDLIEIELEIESKNDYEYLIFEDMKAAGFESVGVRSGYDGGRGLGAYMELRDNRVSLFVRRLARGKHSIAYRMRAEIPGKFSALPTRAYAMYAPELKANSDEIKLQIVD